LSPIFPSVAALTDPIPDIEIKRQLRKEWFEEQTMKYDSLASNYAHLNANYAQLNANYTLITSRLSEIEDFIQSNGDGDPKNSPQNQ